jgi:hypothetical protein
LSLLISVSWALDLKNNGYNSSLNCLNALYVSAGPHAQGHHNGSQRSSEISSEAAKSAWKPFGEMDELLAPSYCVAHTRRVRCASLCSPLAGGAVTLLQLMPKAAHIIHNVRFDP